MIEYIKKHDHSIILISASVLAVILRFARINSGDLYGDNAINSFRAYGWFDYLGHSGQSAPFDWLGHIPAWARLSFHDGPPVAFYIQNIFFRIFGDGAWVARLPFVLAGIGSILMMYLLIRKIVGRSTAILAAAFYAVCSYGVWAGQAGYLEGIQELFIVGCVLFGGYFLFVKRPGSAFGEPENHSGKYIYIWALCLTLALLTKYTAIFLIPPVLIYAFIYRNTVRQYWRHILISLAVGIVLFLPVIIYNIHVYELRGHFDAALSSMVGMHPEDFRIISNREASLNPFPNLVNIVHILSNNVSYPFLILSLICSIVLLWRIRKTGLRNFEAWVLVNAFFLVLMFGFAGVAVRFLSITVPFLVLIVVLGLKYIYEKTSDHHRRLILVSIVSVVLICELFYSFNTNVLKTPVGVSGIFYSSNKIRDLGFNQLNDFIRRTVITALPKKQNINSKEDIIFTADDVRGRSVVVFDDRINWYAQMWYMQRYFLYYRWPVISTSYFSPANANKLDLGELMKVSGRPLYFIYPLDSSVLDAVRNKDDSLNVIGPSLAQYLDGLKVPFTVIKNNTGVSVFKIYRISML